MPGVTTAYQTGVHGSRPAASAGCILYSCTTHGLVYRSDGTTWTTFLTLPAGSASSTPALTFATSASAGVASTFVATDATLAIFDATVPSTQAFGDAAAAGAAGVAARRDHKHAMPATPSSTPLAVKADTSGNHSVTSSALADVDATNAAVTFTAPASGKVLVRITAGISADQGGGTGGAVGDFMSMGLREGSTDIAGAAGTSIVHRLTISGTTVNEYLFTTLAFVLTGISAGSHTYKVSAAVSNTTRCIGVVRAVAAAPLVIEVIELA